MNKSHENIPFVSKKRIFYFLSLLILLSLFWAIVSYILIQKIVNLGNHWLQETTVETLHPQIEHYLLTSDHVALQKLLQKLNKRKVIDYFAVYIQHPDTTIEFSSSSEAPEDKLLLHFPIRFQQNQGLQKAIISVLPRQISSTIFIRNHLLPFLLVIFVVSFISTLFIFFLYYFFGINPLRELANAIDQSSSDSSGIQIKEETDDLLTATNMNVIQIREAIEKLSKKMKTYRRREQSAKRKLSESEEMLHLISGTATDIIVIFDIKGKITFANEAALLLSGYTREEVINKKIIQFLPEEYVHEFTQKIAMRSEGDDRRYLYEMEFNTRSGKRIPVEISSSPILRNGKLTSILIVARNISDRKKAEKELATYRAHLQELVEKRTAELEEKNRELERLNDLFVGREFRIKELKEKIKILSEQIERLKQKLD